MKNIELSARMGSVAAYVLPGSRVADIGCDHAFIPIFLVENHIAKKVIASDVKKGPVAIARGHVEERQLGKYIEVRMGDGLDTISPGEVDHIVIAGMGGMLMLEILSKGECVVEKCRRLILQPQSDIEQVRRYLISKGYVISDETMLCDQKKYYTVLCVEIPDPKQRTFEEYSDIQYKYGKVLIEKNDSCLREYLMKQLEENEKILSCLLQADTDKSRERVKTLSASQTDMKNTIRIMKESFGDV